MEQGFSRDGPGMEGILCRYGLEMVDRLLRDGLGMGESVWGASCVSCYVSAHGYIFR